jgi:hypothetical protein
MADTALASKIEHLVGLSAAGRCRNHSCLRLVIEPGATMVAFTIVLQLTLAHHRPGWSSEP